MHVTVTSSIEAVVSKSIAVAKKGYAGAVERLETAAVDETQPDEAYIALTEAVNWLGSIAGQTDLKGNADVPAVRFARTRAHHEWGSIVLWDKEQKALVWRPASQLLVPKDKRNWNAKRRPYYEKRLEGRPVLEVFEQLRPTVGAARPDPD